MFQFAGCMMYSNGEIAFKTHKNALQNERRKIAKLLLRSFPLQESSSYHNLVEEEDVGQNILQKGNELTQYAPEYPYDGQITTGNQGDASFYYHPSVKTLKRTNPDLSKFAYALSTILLPPPISSSPVETGHTIEATEDAAAEYYAPYIQDMYKTYDDKNLKLTQTLKEDDADKYYLPYMQNKQPEIYSSNNAEEFYLPYHQYAQQQEDDWLAYYQPQPVKVFASSVDELPNIKLGSLYRGPIDVFENNEKAEMFEDELPSMTIGNQFLGPATAENEIFDHPKIFLKFQR